MRYIIASDFHLKITENNEDRLRRVRVEAFLEDKIGQIDGLILLGDIFDLWVEWDKVIIKNYFSILKIFSSLKDAGTRLIFLAGNHDFWLEKFLQETIGFEVYHDFFSDTINEKKIFVSHGDLYTKNDLRYKFFRKFIRQRFIKKLFKLLHPDFGLTIGQLLSRTSRNRKRDPKSLHKKEQGLIQKATTLSPEYDIVVFAHTHKPAKQNINGVIYINTGDWVTHDSYCVFEGDHIDLIVRESGVHIEESL
jgi:UDP-2,3-diacylglucosamine hydrolase